MRVDLVFIGRLLMWLGCVGVMLMLAFARSLSQPFDGPRDWPLLVAGIFTGVFAAGGVLTIVDVVTYMRRVMLPLWRDSERNESDNPYQSPSEGV